MLLYLAYTTYIYGFIREGYANGHSNEETNPSCRSLTPLVGSLKINTALEYSTRVVQEGDRRCKKSTLNDLAYLTPLRIPLMNPVLV
jgi:hypothetical protein